jgi:hypothetical protein
MTPSRPVVVEICAGGTLPVAHTVALRTKADDDQSHSQASCVRLGCCGDACLCRSSIDLVEPILLRTLDEWNPRGPRTV